MRRPITNLFVTVFVFGLLVSGLFLVATAPSPAAVQGGGVTAFEGARLITGDGSAPIDNAVFIVDGTRFAQVGRAGQVQIPAGARRVDLRGKTVMPAVIDTHTHMATSREMLTEQLQRKAYQVVAAGMSRGQDNADAPFQVREQPIPGAAWLRTAGRGITMPEPGRTEAPYWVSTEAEARKAVQELAAK